MQLSTIPERIRSLIDLTADAILLYFPVSWPTVTPKSVQRGDNDIPDNSQTHVYLFPEVNVPQNLKRACHIPLSFKWKHQNFIFD